MNTTNVKQCFLSYVNNFQFTLGLHLRLFSPQMTKSRIAWSFLYLNENLVSCNRKTSFSSGNELQCNSMQCSNARQQPMSYINNCHGKSVTVRSYTWIKQTAGLMTKVGLPICLMSRLIIMSSEDNEIKKISINFFSFCLKKLWPDRRMASVGNTLKSSPVKAWTSCSSLERRRS